MSNYRKLKTEILELRRQNKSYREISNILSCNRSVINYHCVKHNLTDTGKKRYALTTDFKLAISDFCKNHSNIEAQKHFNISKATVFKYRNFKIETNEQEKNS